MNSPPLRHSRTALPRRWLVLETCLMIVFITLALWYTGRVASLLLNLYLLVIIAGAIGHCTRSAAVTASPTTTADWKRSPRLPETLSPAGW